MILELCFALLCIYMIKTYLENRKLPPGPYGVPLLGYIPFMGVSKQHLKYWNISKKYKNETISVRFGSKLIIVMHNPDTIKQAFSKAELTGRLNGFPIDIFLGGNYGLVMSTGQLWHEQRRFALRHLRDMGMGKGRLEDTVLHEAQTIVSLFKKESGTPQDISKYLNLAILNVIWSLISGKQFAYNDSSLLDLLNRQQDIASDFAPVALLMFLPWAKPFVPESFVKSKKLMSLLDEQHERLHAEIREHKKNFDKNSLNDWIDYFLEEIEMQKDNPETSFTEWQLYVAIKDLFFAGVETTSTTIRWGVLCLAANPEVQKKAQDEIDLVVGRSRLPQLQDKPNMPYIEALLSEIQRFADIVPIGAERDAEADIEIDGYHVPKGSVVFANLHACHNDPEQWEKPGEFYPEHFIDKDGKFIQNKEGFMPFGTGKRQCLGEALARMELFIFMSSFLHQFTFKIPEGETVTYEPIVDSPMIIRAPKNYKVIIEER